MHPSEVKNIFLTGVSFVYLWAFASLYHQIPGLYGDSGIFPVESQLGNCEKERDLVDCGFSGESPNVLHVFVRIFGFSASESLEFCSLVGVFLSSLAIIFPNLRDFFVFLPMWYCYYSCTKVGQTFLWFQWDTLLNEMGFLTVMVAPISALRLPNRTLAHDNVALFLVKWLAFRLMFASGVVKLTSECPTWWNLTALHYHYESQCIPNPLAWYAHALCGDWTKKFSVAATYYIEILAPPMFLLPLKHIRKFAFFTQFLLMIFIMLTGNFNFFNTAYTVACVPLLADSDYSNVSTKAILSKKLDKLYSVLKVALISAVYVVSVYYFVKWFGIKVNLELMVVESSVAFSKQEFYRTLSWAMAWIVPIGCALFAFEVLTAFIRCFADVKKTTSVIRKTVELFQCFIACAFCSVLFAVSLIPFNSGILGHRRESNLWPEIYQWYPMADKYSLVNSYGLFRSMTGVGGRPEVIVEGANQLKGPWVEYDFLYKPGDLARTPPFLIPHQARLDWQMWFAALGSYQYNPWFISMAYKFLQNEEDVINLIEHNPFPKNGPKFVRAKLYHYHYTEKMDDKNWWWRELKREYMPPISLESQNIVDFLKQNGFLVQKEQVKELSVVGHFLSTLRQSANQFEPAVFVWAITVSVLILWFLKKKL